MNVVLQSVEQFAQKVS